MMRSTCPYRVSGRRSGRLGRSVLLAAIALIWGPVVADAWAQPWTADFWKRFGVAVNVVRVEPTDREVDPVVDVGGSGGFFPDHGWGPAFGLGWFTTDLSSNGLKVGQLKTRPLLGGVGYTWVRGRLATKASLTAGIVLNSATLDEELLDQISGPVSLDVRNSFAVRPAVALEYSVFRKLGVRGTLAYLATRPSVVVTTPEGRTSGTWNASSVSFQAGVVVYPFR
jgi:hypothetical protein